MWNYTDHDSCMRTGHAHIYIYNYIILNYTCTVKQTMVINIPVYCSMLAPHPPPSTRPNSKIWRAKKVWNLHWFVLQLIL